MIKLDGNFYIDADTYGYAVKRETGKDKEGKIIYTSIAYPSTLSKCIEFIISYKQKQFIQDNNVTLGQVLEEFKRIHDDLQSSLKKLDSFNYVEQPES